MRLRVLDITDVTERHLCCGCGTCASVCPDRYEMVDTLDHGRRPRLRPDAPRGHDAAVRACPGLGVEHDPRPETLGRMDPRWGPVVEVWEGAATDEAIRHAGSSGGGATAVALWAIEAAGMHGVLHIAARVDAPYLNHTVLSTTREELLARAGSRYAPASPCDGLRLIEAAPQPCVFIGKPCDIAGARAAGRLRPALDRNLGLTIAIFCAGTPTIAGTYEMLLRMGIEDPSTLVELRYRGHGWPGEATATVRTPGGTETRALSYDVSWGDVLSRHRQWRCRVCADHTGELADVAVGDPWHRPITPGEPGRSLLVARTDRGRTAIRDAIAAGFLAAEHVETSTIAASQPELLRVRGAVWGRLLALRLMGLPVPRYRGMPLFRTWLGALTPAEKTRSVLGTIARVLRRRLYRRETAAPLEEMPATAGRVSIEPTVDQPARAAA